MLLILILEGDDQVAQGRRLIGFRARAVRSRASGSSRSFPPCRCSVGCTPGRQRRQADLPGESVGLFGGIGWPLSLSQSTGATGSLRWPPASRYEHRHPVTVYAGYATDGLTATAVQGESHSQFFSILPAELEAIRTPAGIVRVHCDTTVVTPRHTRPLTPSRSWSTLSAFTAKRRPPGAEPAVHAADATGPGPDDGPTGQPLTA